ncbi:uncharacterized protein LOC126776602 [Nymphalis io]|uniref:uncharacterized protein LOC126776602 n=1 Tax=Inachis io TaxID=171585 RepID=UPI00216A4733|nr:uncharacterized protein LOC126776602 [Nymphalis io]
MYQQDTDELKRHFTNMISIFRTPKLIVRTDRGRMFQSVDFLNWVKDMAEVACGYVEVTTDSQHNKTQDDAILCLELAHRRRSGYTAHTSVTRSSGNREAIREISRQRAFEHICDNQARQDAYVNRRRKPTQTFELHSLVFVRKQAQSTGKLDSCMRGPYRVVKILPHGRYELQLLAGSYGKSTQAAAEYIVPWRGEWTPDVCAAFFDDADTEEEELTAGVDLRPGVVQPVEEIEPQQGPSGIQRFSELAASTVKEENPLLSVPIVETDRDS